MTTFTAEIYQNEYLPVGGGEVNVVVSVTSTARDGAATPPSATHSVSLRLWTPRQAAVTSVRQVVPTLEDLTDRAVPVNSLQSDYPTGTWGRESRDYQLRIRFPPLSAGDEMLAGRVWLVEGDDVLTQGLIKAIWTDDPQLSIPINPKVAHYNGETELASCIQKGLEARKAGDEATATLQLGRAVRRAYQSGTDDVIRLLELVIDIQDTATGTVRLRRRWPPDDPGGHDPEGPAGQGVREPRRPTPPRGSGAIRLPRPDNIT
jgi:hypothetical protein